MQDLNKVFFVDDVNIITYKTLLDRINCVKFYKSITFTEDVLEIFQNIIVSLIIDKPITLLDSDLSEEEIQNIGIRKIELNQYEKIEKFDFTNFENIFELFKNKKNWRITLFTSGTTGKPKKVIHNYQNITRKVIIDPSKSDNIWGFCYNPTHIAGIQVFFQAFLNLNSIIYLFNKNTNIIYELIDDFVITNISSTSTFLRLLSNTHSIHKSVRKITSGGEMFDSNLVTKLLKIFPNSSIRNIYASTEAGTLFSSKGDTFEIESEMLNKIKIVNNELLIHKCLLGSFDESSQNKISDDWYFTGDIVEIIQNEPFTIRFINRKKELINVGGYKVNPNEVEEVLNLHPSIKLSKVYSKSNSVIGNIIIADVLAENKIDELELKTFLKNRLQDYKVPRIINFKDSISLTNSGKLKRQ